MTREHVLKMIKEYLLEPNNITTEWVEALKICEEDVYAAMLRENANSVSNFNVPKFNLKPLARTISLTDKGATMVFRD